MSAFKYISIFLIYFSFVNLQAEEMRISPDQAMESVQARAFAEELLDDSHQEQTRGFWSWLFGTNSKDTSVNFSKELVLELKDSLGKKVFGQEDAIEVTAGAIARYAAGVNSPDSPIATLLYIGPTGVGKTALAKALAEELYGSADHMLRLDMSEYGSWADATKIIGQAVGWVGAESGGKLTNFLDSHSQAVILLDEIEKADPKIQKLFLGIFDEGRVTSGMMKTYDCRECIFIATTNICGPESAELQNMGFESNEVLTMLQPALMNVLSPELYNRVDPVLFKGIKPDVLQKIITRELALVSKRVKKSKGIYLQWHDSVSEYLMETGYSPELGARPVKRLIEKELVTSLAYALLEGIFQKGDLVEISYDHGDLLLRSL